jgi:predicted DNA-binding WGR domain protein
MIMLRRTDAERNMHRFYALGVMPTLFGEWTLIAEWGRIGSPGTVRRSIYADEHSASEALNRRISDKSRRGYHGDGKTLVRSYLVSDMAVSEWSDGSSTTSPCKPSTTGRKVGQHPNGLQSFDW